MKPADSRIFHIYKAHVTRTGADGGHRYLQGRCEWEGSESDVTVLFASRNDELALSDGEAYVVATVANFVKGAGLLLFDAKLVGD
ncbi:hypothetical protein SH501x_001274 [Pirellulaceae bacterium SH501]